MNNFLLMIDSILIAVPIGIGLRIGPILSGMLCIGLNILFNQLVKEL